MSKTCSLFSVRSIYLATCSDLISSWRSVIVLLLLVSVISMMDRFGTLSSQPGGAGAAPAQRASAYGQVEWCYIADPQLLAVIAAERTRIEEVSERRDRYRRLIDQLKAPDGRERARYRSGYLDGLEIGLRRIEDHIAGIERNLRMLCGTAKMPDWFDETRDAGG